MWPYTEQEVRYLEWSPTEKVGGFRGLVTLMQAVAASPAEAWVQFRRRSRERHELLQLEERDLKDLGLSRCEVLNEAAKPFWQQ